MEFSHPFSIKNLLASSYDSKVLKESVGNQDLLKYPSRIEDQEKVGPINLSVSTAPYIPPAYSTGSLSPTSSITGTEFSSESPLPQPFPSPIGNCVSALMHPKSSTTPPHFSTLHQPMYPVTHHNEDEYNSYLQSMLMSSVRAHPYAYCLLYTSPSPRDRG